MDFKRIQIVLIIFFLIFDAYLLFMLFERAEPITMPSLAVDAPIEQRLEERGITFGELDSQSVQLPFVATEQSNHLAENIAQLENQDASLSANGVLSSEFDEPIDLGLDIDEETTGLSEEQREEMLEILSDNELFIEGDKYQNFWYVNTENAIYIRMLAYDGHPIVDGTAEIRITLDENYLMTGYTQTYQNEITALDSAKQMISEREAIEIIDGRAQTLIPDNSTIHYSLRVYYRSNTLEEFSVYSPAWQVVYDNEDGRFTLMVDGLRGTFINQNQLFQAQ